MKADHMRTLQQAKQRPVREPSIECNTLAERGGSVPSAFGETSGVPPPFTAKAQPHDALDTPLADFYATETWSEADERRRRDSDGGDASPLDAERRAHLVQQPPYISICKNKNHLA